MLNHCSLQTPGKLDVSVLAEFKRNTNIHADVCDALIFYLTDLPVTTTHSLKMQASTLSRVTQTTNQLTRNALVYSLTTAHTVNVSLLLLIIGTGSDEMQSTS